MEHSPSALHLCRVAKLYGANAALRSVTIQAEAGKTLALLGQNGSGKTTMLKIAAGAIAPTLGTGSVYGHDLVRERHAIRPLVGMLAAETYLYEDLSARENLHFVSVMSGRKMPASRIQSLIVRVGLDAAADLRVRGFSSGMKRRLGLARLMLMSPQLLLLDEPYNSLDTGGMELVDQFIQESTGAGLAVIMASHDVERCLSIADHVGLLRQGTLQFVGPAAHFRSEAFHGS